MARRCRRRRSPQCWRSAATSRGSSAQQSQRHWGRWPARLLHEKTVGILGIGVIAEALAPKCKAMGMTVIGITSAPRDVAGFDRMHPVSELVGVCPSSTISCC